MKTYYVVFLNDAPLYVCLTKKAADSKVLWYIRKARNEFRKNAQHMKDEDKIQKFVKASMIPLYYHWHEVDGEKQ